MRVRFALRGLALMFTAAAMSVSQAVAEPGLLLIAHGSHSPKWSGPVLDFGRRVEEAILCGKAGISYADWAFIGVGQEYLGRGVPAIRAALEQKKRVLVVGLYLSTNPARIYQRVVSRGHAPDRDPFGDQDVVLSEGSIIDYSGFLPAVVKAAHAALGAPDGAKVARQDRADKAALRNSP